MIAKLAVIKPLMKPDVTCKILFILGFYCESFLKWASLKDGQGGQLTILELWT